jgi:hypothetical protein
MDRMFVGLPGSRRIGCVESLNRPERSQKIALSSEVAINCRVGQTGLVSYGAQGERPLAVARDQFARSLQQH